MMAYSGQPTSYLPPGSFTPVVRDRTTTRASVQAPQRQFNPEDSLTPEEADCLCCDIGEQNLCRILTTLVGLGTRSRVNFYGWLITDVRVFISSNLDLGTAYAVARTAWKHFNVTLLLDVSSWRQKIWTSINDMAKRRETAVSEDEGGRGMIADPYDVMPRRIWDLKSNRVVDFCNRMADFLVLKKGSPHMIPQGQRYPHFWAVTHSWTADMKGIESSVNGNQWPIPLPAEVTLEQVRNELLSFGGEYVWLDVVCLRQDSGMRSTQLKAKEWQVDVPTIGNIYLAASRIVRYFNGLGRKFSPTGWEIEQHWLKRAWTLQEMRPESITQTGGVSPGVSFLDTVGPFGPDGCSLTLRAALAHARKIAEDADDPTGMGCTVFDLITEMRGRHASNPVDKVAGLVYLLRTPRLPTYTADITDEEAWVRCCDSLSFVRKLELLFDFPGRGSDTQWYPTWRQLTSWPARRQEVPHKAPGWHSPAIPRFRPTIPLGMPGALTLGAYLLWDVLIESSDHPGEYYVRRRPSLETKQPKVVVFSTSYENQTPIPNGRYTLAGSDMSEACNWVVCNRKGGISGVMETLPLRTNQAMPPPMCVPVQAALFQKVSVLRTDYTSELSHGDLCVVQNPLLCVFV